MKGNSISAGKLTRLQVLWNQYVRLERWAVPRESALARLARLEWATKNCGRVITSFKDLSSREAASLINVLQTALGIAETSPPQTRRQRAQAMGAEGRRGRRASSTIAAQEDLDRVAQQLTTMGWDQARLDAFLRSPSSPLRGRTDPKLRTVGDCNRVIWALRRIAARSARGGAA